MAARLAVSLLGGTAMTLIALLLLLASFSGRLPKATGIHRLGSAALARGRRALEVGLFPEVPSAGPQQLTIVTLCSAESRQLCIVSGSGRRPLQPQEQSEPPCWAPLKDGVYLDALLLGFERVLVHRFEEQLSPVHFDAATIPEIVFSHPTAGRLSRVWAASPRRDRKVFELGCSILASRPNMTMADMSIESLFLAVRFGAAFFPRRVNYELPVPPPPQPREAYATFISSRKHDWYVDSVRLLNHGLKQHCALAEQRPLVAMVLAGDGVEGAAWVNLLREEGVVVNFVTDVRTRFNRGGRFLGIWAKQRVWQLVDYDKVVFLDPDQLLLRCPASLFRYPVFSHAVTWHKEAKFNSGLLVVRPNLGMMRKIERLVRTSGKTNDQDLTEAYFDGRGVEFPEYFSLWKRHSYLQKNHWDVWKHCAHFLHYTGEKAWQKNLPPIRPAAMRFFHEYFKFIDEGRQAPGRWLPYNRSTIEEQHERTDFSLCPFSQ